MQAGALEEAVKYGRNQLGKFYGLPGFQDLVQVLRFFFLVGSVESFSTSQNTLYPSIYMPVHANSFRIFYKKEIGPFMDIMKRV